MKIALPVKFVELEDENFHLIICSQINCKKANWIIDTGASKTVFDKNRTDDYKLLNEKDEIHSIEFSETPIFTPLAEIKSVRFESSEIPIIKVAIIDLSHINNLYKKAGGPEICGLIGSDFLIKFNAVINYKTKILNLTINSD